MIPIILPHSTDPAWGRAETIARELRREGEQNPLIIAAVVNAYAEAAWKPHVVGDHGQSFGPWQIKFAYYGIPLMDRLGVDIRRSDVDLNRHTQALTWLLRKYTVDGMRPLGRVADALDAARTGGDATRIFCAGFERASAPGAVERRVAIAPAIEVWLARLTP